MSAPPRTLWERWRRSLSLSWGRVINAERFTAAPANDHELAFYGVTVWSLAIGVTHHRKRTEDGT